MFPTLDQATAHAHADALRAEAAMSRLRRLAACCAPLWSRTLDRVRSYVRSTQIGPGYQPLGTDAGRTAYFQPCCS